MLNTGENVIVIQTDIALGRAISEIDHLLSQSPLAANDEDQLDQLSKAVRDYERGRYPVPVMSPVEQLNYLLRLHKLTQRKLASRTGVQKKKIRAVLAGTDTFEKAESERLASFFALDASAFCAAQPYIVFTLTASVGAVKGMINQLKKVAAGKNKSCEITIPLHGMVRVEPTQLQFSTASV